MGVDVNGAGAHEGAGASLRRYLQTLIEHWWIVVLCVVVTTAAAAVYVVATPKKYTAESQMLVTAIPSGSTNLIGLPLLFSSGNPTQDVLTGTSLITTPQVAAAVISQLHLHETPTELLQKVTATPIGQSSLVAVQATDTSAARARAIANAFSGAVVETRTATLHNMIAAILPGLQAQVVRQPAAAVTLGPQLSELDTLSRTNDPTITPSAPASLPTSPTSPQTKLSLAAGILGGLILGVGAAFAFNALDPRLRRDEQVRSLFGVPVLAHIPREPGKHRQPMLPNELSFGAQEGFRTLRAILTTRAGRRSRAYLVTGSSPAEGKTTTAIGLAATLSQGGARVILIEADLRRPTIAASVGLKVRIGTEHVLSGEASLSDALIATEIDGSSLYVLAVRTPAVKLADRLTIGVAQRLIDEARGIADFVVLDSPPLNAVSDAIPLAREVDEVLVVARLGVSRLSKLTALRNLLREQNAYPSGLVLVGEAARRASPYYYAAEPLETRRTSAESAPAEIGPMRPRGAELSRSNPPPMDEPIGEDALPSDDARSQPADMRDAAAGASVRSQRDVSR